MKALFEFVVMVGIACWGCWALYSCTQITRTDRVKDQ